MPDTTVVAGQKAVQPIERVSAAQNRTKRNADAAQLREALETLEKRMPVNVNFDITYDETIAREVVRGTSTVTGETVIEFPTEQMQKLIRGLREELGLAVDEQV